MPPKSQAPILRSLLSAETDELYGLKDIGTTRSWDYSLPTLGSHRSFTDRLSLKSDESFFGIFEKDVNKGLPHRILEDAGAFEEGNDLVLFGGCILDVLLKRHDSIKDFDLRLVGERYIVDEEKCVAKAKEFISSVFSTLSRENGKIDEEVEKAKKGGRRLLPAVEKCDLQEVVVSRSRSTVSVHVPSFADKEACVFQLTFAPAPDVRGMLARCQPHCTRLAIENGAVVLDHLARYCIESTCIVLDTSDFVDYYCGEADDDDERAKRLTSGRTVTSQIARYLRYYEEKGFDIVLPDLDMSKVPRRNLAYDVVEVLPLPSMTVVYDEVDKNLIMTTKLDLSKDFKERVAPSGLIGAYDSSPAPNVGDAIHYNIRCLVHDVYDSFKYVAKGERWDQVFDYVPSLTPRMVKKSYETVVEDLTGGVISVKRLTGYFSVTPPDEVVEKLISEPLRNKLCRKGALPKPYVLDEDELKKLTEKEIDGLIRKIEGLRKTLEDRSLDRLVMPYPENVSTNDEVYDVMYGTHGLKQKGADR